MRHTNDEICEKCEEHLSKTHQTLVDWFRSVRKDNREIHISCSVRGEPDQRLAFIAGTSKAEFGKSPHNYIPALAIDLFRMDGHGGAFWEPRWYRETFKPKLVPGLTWGADFKTIIDYPHFELTYWKKLVEDKVVKLWSKSLPIS